MKEYDVVLMAIAQANGQRKNADMFPTEQSVNDALRQFLASQSLSA
jgi:hypothetical protein